MSKWIYDLWKFLKNIQYTVFNLFINKAEIRTFIELFKPVFPKVCIVMCKEVVLLCTEILMSSDIMLKIGIYSILT